MTLEQLEKQAERLAKLFKELNFFQDDLRPEQVASELHHFKIGLQKLIDDATLVQKEMEEQASQ